MQEPVQFTAVTCNVITSSYGDRYIFADTETFVKLSTEM